MVFQWYWYSKPWNEHAPTNQRVEGNTTVRFNMNYETVTKTKHTEHHGRRHHIHWGQCAVYANAWTGENDGMSMRDCETLTFVMILIHMAETHANLAIARRS